MKSLSQVESRLKKLRIRYAHKYVEATQSRCFRNCEYNQEHAPNELDYGRHLETEWELAPRIQKTLIVFSEHKPVHLCMYGSDKGTWPGDTCDEDDKARQCPMFKPRVSLEQAKSEFLDKLSDDEYVFDNYRDVATLQWVLGQRIHDVPLTLFERFLFWIKSKMWKPVPLLPAASNSDIPSDLWDNHDSPSSP